jgi:hypothetical protein
MDLVFMPGKKLPKDCIITLPGPRFQRCGDRTNTYDTILERSYYWNQWNARDAG